MTMWPILPMWNGNPCGVFRRFTRSASNMLSLLPASHRRRVFRGDAIELRRHDKVVLVQTFDLFRPQRDGGEPPAETDVRVVTLGLGQCRGALDKGEGLAEVLEAVGPLDSRRVVDQHPVGCLLVQFFGLVVAQRGDAAATRRTGLLGEG